MKVFCKVNPLRSNTLTEPKEIWYDVTPTPGIVSEFCQIIFDKMQNCTYETSKKNCQTFLNVILLNSFFKPASPVQQRKNLRKFKDSILRNLKYMQCN